MPFGASPLFALFIKKFNIRTNTIITMLITLPTPYSCDSKRQLMESPNIYTVFWESIPEIANAEIVGINTIVIPLIIPGRESGRVVLKKVSHGVAPKSFAASA